MYTDCVAAINFAGSCTFRSQPTNIHVLSGDSAWFGCDCQEETHDAPSWIIDSVIYPHSYLPPPYHFNSQLSSLEITKVATSMNLTNIQCLIGSMYSTIGIVYVLDNDIIDYTPTTRLNVRTESHFMAQSSPELSISFTGKDIYLELSKFLLIALNY